MLFFLLLLLWKTIYVLLKLHKIKLIEDKHRRLLLTLKNVEKWQWLKISAMVKHANKPFNAAQLGNFLPCVQIVSRGSLHFHSILIPCRFSSSLLSSGQSAKMLKKSQLSIFTNVWKHILMDSNVKCEAYSILAIRLIKFKCLNVELVRVMKCMISGSV